MDYTTLCPQQGKLEVVNGAQPLSPFHTDILAFIDDLSQEIIKEEEFRRFPEIIAAGYWLRKSAIQRLKHIFIDRGGKQRVARGLVFHLAPSNVDTIFMYSLFLSLLVGNTNIVRISFKSNKNIQGLLAVINRVCANHISVSHRFLIVNYEHDDTINGYFSEICAMRVIWGGHETINRIRSIQIPPSAHEITFADKFSIALINAENYLAYNKKEDIAIRFFNDAFWFDQLACSSPRLIGWIGTSEQITTAKEKFWSSISAVIAQKEYESSPSGNMDTYVALCQYAALDKNTTIPDSHFPSIKRITIPKTTELSFRDIHCGQGLFIEMNFDDLKDVAHITQSKDQTITAFGFSSEAMKKQLIPYLKGGVNRIVGFGNALTFSHDWDGYDLLNEFTRIITVEDALY
ncbi:MAG: hypothetical protein D8M57_03910 [Candidatus Scalindua sp. AMX11]|nr:MAG: hypothetical protein DWQ00_10785 [Candidatus Scalindua sp.]NOG82690.1 hypothetical protein [Planctomycetota bacterium]RZV95264.1 MAG: hypothetical protein EX341_02725 [Candidatus Scalindua sp. SCAELEC01]TDE66256.1 MAG: hypothetical protein D8M57_03910 [Candidatus Scalindua sp. AMX11]GJQ57879.1 MAG: hypothetical protein SCALA701_06800 [Candidatus Scalindua sp.]